MIVIYNCFIVLLTVVDFSCFTLSKIVNKLLMYAKN